MVAVFCLIAYVVNLIIGRVLNHLALRYESPLRSMEIRVIGALRMPLALVIIVLGLRVALTSLSQSSASSLEFVAGLGEFGRIVWLIAVTAIVCYTLSRLIRALMRWQSARVPTETRTALNTVIWPILIRISSIIIFALGALIVLDILGIPITPLLAGIGIGGIAIALALSPTISSFIAGTYVVAEGHISEGDYRGNRRRESRLRRERRLAQHRPSQPLQQHDCRSQQPHNREHRNQLHHAHTLP